MTFHFASFGGFGNPYRLQQSNSLKRFTVDMVSGFCTARFETLGEQISSGKKRMPEQEGKEFDIEQPFKKEGHNKIARARFTASFDDSHDGVNVLLQQPMRSRADDVQREEFGLARTLISLKNENRHETPDNSNTPSYAPDFTTSDTGIEVTSGTKSTSKSFKILDTADSEASTHTETTSPINSETRELEEMHFPPLLLKYFDVTVMTPEESQMLPRVSNIFTVIIVLHSCHLISFHVIQNNVVQRYNSGDICYYQ